MDRLLELVQALAVLSSIRSPSSLWVGMMLFIFSSGLILNLILRRTLSDQFHQVYPHLLVNPGLLYGWMGLPAFPEILDQLNP